MVDAPARTAAHRSPRSGPPAQFPARSGKSHHRRFSKTTPDVLVGSSGACPAARAGPSGDRGMRAAGGRAIDRAAKEETPVRETILVDRDGAVATIVLNRPDVLNAVDRKMRHELIAAMGELNADASVRADRGAHVGTHVPQPNIGC